MKRITRTLLLTFAMFVGSLSFTPMMASDAGAINVFKNCSGGPVCNEAKKGKGAATPIIRNIINLLLYAIGVIAVIAIIIGGFRYMTSNGESSKIKAAKDTILYAVVGLVVAIMAFGIVQFVLNQFGK